MTPSTMQGLVRRKTTSVVKAFDEWFERFKIPEDPNKTFLQRYKEHVAHLKEERQKPEFKLQSVRFTSKMLRYLIAFQAPTMMYVYMFYIVPHTFEGYSLWTQFFMKLLCWYILFNDLSNYLLVLFTDPTKTKAEMKENPFLRSETNLITQSSVHLIPQINNGDIDIGNANGHSVLNMDTKEGLEWKYCQKCSSYKPPRSHHCKYCDKCILKRDHHCNMVGNCVGYNNQRFFTVLTFYALITGILGAFFTMKYIYEAIWPTMYSWTDLILPITFVRYLTGTVQPLHALLILHCYLEIPFGCFGIMHFFSSMMYAFLGLTPYEVEKQPPIKNINTPRQNMRAVFGAYWFLNFLFPVYFFFKETDDGVNFDYIKIDHNAKAKSKDKNENEKAQDTGETSPEQPS